MTAMKERFNFGMEDDAQEKSDNSDIQRYSNAAQVRSVTFVLQDGESHTFFYYDLRKITFMPKDQSISLTFVGETVILKGRGFEKLVKDFQKQLVCEIKATDERYEATKGDNEIVVTEMKVSATDG